LNIEKKHEILLKNYGRYEPGVGMAKDFKEKKTLTSANMINELAERISNYTGAEIDDKTLYSAIYGKASNKENLKRQGLRQMLQTMGAIPDERPVKRKGKIEELKLLYFLCFSKYRIPYDFEKLDNTSSKAKKTYNRSIKWRTYFNNISSENISIPVHSSSDQNGRIMVYLKANVFRELDLRFVESLCSDISETDKIIEIIINKLMNMPIVYCGSKADVERLNRIKAWIDRGISVPEADKADKEDVFSTFFLYLVGREQNVIIDEAINALHETLVSYEQDAYCKFVEESVSDFTMQTHKEYKRLKEKTIYTNCNPEIDPKDNGFAVLCKNLSAYIEQHKKELTKLVFQKDNPSKNESHELDTASKRVNKYLEIIIEIIPGDELKQVPVLLLVSILQEIVLTMHAGREATLKYYGHNSNDDKQTEGRQLLQGRGSFYPNRIILSNVPLMRYYKYQGMEEDYRTEIEIIIKLFNYKKKIYSAHSITAMDIMISRLCRFSEMLNII
jgi:hypothetical protein